MLVSLMRCKVDGNSVCTNVTKVGNVSNSMKNEVCPGRFLMQNMMRFELNHMIGVHLVGIVLEHEIGGNSSAVHRE